MQIDVYLLPYIHGIISEQQIDRKPSILNCPRCSLVNAIDNKYCSKCSYPLVTSTIDDSNNKETINDRLQSIMIQYIYTS
jgi:hypothetical protein